MSGLRYEMSELRRIKKAIEDMKEEKDKKDKEKKLSIIVEEKVAIFDCSGIPGYDE